jgi:hypothetical protein
VHTRGSVSDSVTTAMINLYKEAILVSASEAFLKKLKLKYKDLVLL